MHVSVYMKHVFCWFAGMVRKVQIRRHGEGAKRTRRASRSRTKVFSLALGLLMIVLLTIVAETGVRAFCPQRIIPQFIESAPWGIRKVMAHVDGVHKTAEYSYRYRSNSQGFRGVREYTLVHPADCFRIVVQGDSVTMGLGVSDNETYAHLLEEMLRRDGMQAEVINMGVPGFGTAEEIIQFREVAAKYKPDLVILGFFYNDYMNNAICGLFTLEEGGLRRSQDTFCPGIYIRDRLNRVPGYSFLSQHSQLVTLVRNAISYHIMEGLERKAGYHRPRTATDEAADQTVLLTKRLLEMYAREVTQTGARLYIVDLADKSWTSCFPRDLAHDTRTRCISTYEAFSRALAQGRNPFYKYDGHPDAEGHRAIADCIHEAIRRDRVNGVLACK